MFGKRRLGNKQIFGSFQIVFGMGKLEKLSKILNPHEAGLLSFKVFRNVKSFSEVQLNGGGGQTRR